MTAAEFESQVLMAPQKCSATGAVLSIQDFVKCMGVRDEYRWGLDLKTEGVSRAYRDLIRGLGLIAYQGLRIA